MALVWLVSRQIPLALCPFAIYSFFHVCTYSKTYLIPTIQPGAAPASPGSPSSSRPATRPPLAEALGRFIKKYYDTSMALVASFELSLFVRLVGTALTFSSGSWILLTVYFFFFRARYSSSSFVQGVVAHSTARIDVLVSHQNTPAVLRQGWEVFKQLVRQAYDATDIRRYLGRYQAGAAGAKKPQ